MAFMALSDSKVKTCLKNYETLKKQYDDLRTEFNKSQSNLANYKRGLASVEEQLVFYRKNEVIFCDKIAVLKRDVSFKDSDISWLKSELEKVKLEKENYQLKIENFENASKSLDQLLGSQIIDKSRKEEFQEPEFEGYGPKTSKSASEDISNEVRKSNDAPLVEKLVSDDKLEKKIVFPAVAKIEFVKSKQQEKPVRKPVKSGLLSLNTARQSHFNAVRTNQVNAVKASACWVWRPIKPNSALITLKKYDYVDVRGRSSRLVMEKKLELVEHHKRNKAELEYMRKEIEDQREKLVTSKSVAYQIIVVAELLWIFWSLALGIGLCSSKLVETDFAKIVQSVDLGLQF
ncbi:hypothetical protein Tco_0032143 [Tanacetum coccineum]